MGALAKRALRWPKHHFNTAAVTTLEMESVRSRLLVRKLGFLKRTVRDGATGVGAAAMRSMVDDVACVWSRNIRNLKTVSGLSS